MADCNICCEKLNNSTRKEVTCVFCEFSVCRTCFQKYITETTQDPHCMGCKKNFTYDYINDNCTSVFVTKTLKSHRENVLFDRERALLPETQPHVVVELKRRELKKQASDFQERLNELRRQEHILAAQISHLNYEASHLTINNVNTVTPEDRKKFIRKCPINECRGFLSSQWKCGSCEKRICNRCNEEKLTDHVCLPENVASMELLNKDTKPCPNCGTMIFRISGCSQMFCTDCHTAWDWNTERIVNGVIHNPHYYEFIHRNGGQGRNHADIPCGGLPDIYDMRALCSLLSDNIATKIRAFHMCVTHIQHVEMRNHILENTVETNRELRIKYLINEIDENGFKALLQQSEKKRQKKIAFRNIYQMFIDVTSDILRQIYVNYAENVRASIKTEKFTQFINFVKENVLVLDNLKEYFNENLKKIGKMYKCVYPGISSTFHFVHNIEADIKRKANNVT